MKYLIVIYSFIILLTSCDKHELTPTEYVEWIGNKENGMMISRQMEDFEFDLIYKPLDYIVAREANEDNLARKWVEERKEKLGNMYYFTFKIRNLKSGANDLLYKSASTEEEYMQLQEYCNSKMKDDFSLIVGNDTMPCALFHFEHNYGLAPFNIINLAFEDNSQSPDNNDLIFKYDDKLFGSGPLLFTIESNSLNEIPTMKID